MSMDFDLRKLPDGFVDNPYPTYRTLREQSPVRLMPDGSWLLTRHADVVQVYRDATVFVSDKRAEFGPKYGVNSPLYTHHTNSLVFNDAPRHTRVRNIIMGALSRRAIDDMQDGLVTLVDGLLDHMAQAHPAERPSQPLDLIAHYASAIPVDIIGNLLAIPAADRSPLRDWSLAILGALEPTLTPDQLQRGHDSVQAFTQYLKGLVAQRRAQPGDPQHDVLTRLIQSEQYNDGQPLSEDELLQNCIFLLNAGHETTTNLIGNALVTLAQHPAQRAQLLHDLNACAPGSDTEQAVMALAVDEFLRFESSNQLGNRRAAQDTTIGQQAIPAGSLITLCIGAANRDPAVFTNPDTLNLRRSPNKHLAFGFGVHQCAGLSLARLEGRVAIARFLRRFPNYHLAGAPARSQRARFRGFTAVPFATGM
jgi:cytochrome P450